MTDGQTDWLAGKSDFIGRCPTNVKSTIEVKLAQIHLILEAKFGDAP